MMIIPIGACGHVATVLKCVVSYTCQIAIHRASLFLRAYSSQTPCTRAEQVANLLRMGGTDCGCTEAICQFGFMQLVVATKQHEHRLRFTINCGKKDQGLYLPRIRHSTRKRWQIFNCTHS